METIPFQDLKIVKAEFGETEKDPVKPLNFEPGHSSFDASVMKDMLRKRTSESVSSGCGSTISAKAQRTRNPKVSSS